MTAIRRNLLRRIAKQSGASLVRLVREFKGKSALEIYEAVH